MRGHDSTARCIRGLTNVVIHPGYMHNLRNFETKKTGLGFNPVVFLDFFVLNNLSTLCVHLPCGGGCPLRD